MGKLLFRLVHVAPRVSRVRVAMQLVGDADTHVAPLLLRRYATQPHADDLRIVGQLASSAAGAKRVSAMLADGWLDGIGDDSQADAARAVLKYLGRHETGADGAALLRAKLAKASA